MTTQATRSRAAAHWEGPPGPMNSLNPSPWKCERSKLATGLSVGWFRNPVNSPVDVVNIKYMYIYISVYLQGWWYIPGGCLGFLKHQLYGRSCICMVLPILKFIQSSVQTMFIYLPVTEMMMGQGKVGIFDLGVLPELCYEFARLVTFDAATFSMGFRISLIKYDEIREIEMHVPESVGLTYVDICHRWFQACLMSCMLTPFESYDVFHMF